MEERINVAELLKDCPKGMELDCTMFEDVYFDSIDDVSDIIKCYIQDSKNKIGLSFSKYGYYSNINKTKCVIFPKGKTTWEGFQRPFKDGDVVATDSGKWLGIIKDTLDVEYYKVHCAVDYTFNTTFYRCGEYCFSRFATKVEKQKLFKAIKDNGYKWNAETKTLEKLIEPKFKVGDKVESIFNNNQYIITELTNTHYTLVEVNNKFQYTEPISEDKNWELVTSKFDINTLVPFESRVLVRDCSNSVWRVSLWGCLINHEYGFKYDTIRGPYKQCIPYENNEHLLGKTDDCDEYYKTWE